MGDKAEAAPPPVSPDGRFYWDGDQWVAFPSMPPATPSFVQEAMALSGSPTQGWRPPARQSAPQVSPDGRYYWNETKGKWLPAQVPVNQPSQTMGAPRSADNNRSRNAIIWIGVGLLVILGISIRAANLGSQPNSSSGLTSETPSSAPVSQAEAATNYATFVHPYANTVNSDFSHMLNGGICYSFREPACRQAEVATLNDLKTWQSAIANYNHPAPSCLSAYVAQQQSFIAAEEIAMNDIIRYADSGSQSDRNAFVQDSKFAESYQGALDAPDTSSC